MTAQELINELLDYDNPSAEVFISIGNSFPAQINSVKYKCEINDFSRKIYSYLTVEGDY